MGRGNIAITLLAGACLGGLVVLFLALPRIEANAGFADENMRLYFSALQDIKLLQKTCGSPCRDLELGNVTVFKELYPGAGSAR